MATIFTLEKLYHAYNECLREKKNTVSALTFEVNREKNLVDLLCELQTRTYTISRHICFIVTSPTPREIFAAHMRDRIVHHLLCNEIQGIFEAGFIEHSYANRRGKGSHRAVLELQKNMKDTKRVYERGAYYPKLDIESFFRSIQRTTLYSCVRDTLVSVSCGGGGEISRITQNGSKMCSGFQRR